MPPYLMEMPRSLEAEGQRARTGIKGGGGGRGRGRQPTEKLQGSLKEAEGPMSK